MAGVNEPTKIHRPGKLLCLEFNVTLVKKHKTGKPAPEPGAAFLKPQQPRASFGLILLATADNAQTVAVNQKKENIMTQAKKVKYMAAAMLIVASAFALNVAQASLRDLAEDGYTVAIVQISNDIAR